MKRSILTSLCCAATAAVAFGQLTPPPGYTTVIPANRPPLDPNFQPLVAVNPLPRWTYSIQASAALGSGMYTGSIIGRSPYHHGKTTTGVPTQIVPLIITINDGTVTHVYDPTAMDACKPGHTDVDIITGSPIFTNNLWTMNGVNVGTTQYIDAFQRAEFWTLDANTPLHLNLNQTTLAARSLTFSGAGSSGSGTNYDAAALFGKCGFVGVVNINEMDAAIQALITGPLAATVNAGTFPIFLTKNVVMADPGHSLFSNCCILGYHSGFTSGSNLQIYSPFALDTSGIFSGGGDVSTLSHEMGEAIDDPVGNNPTPAWGHIGQVPNGCQGNFETGDPLSPGFTSPTNEFVLTGNGLTYHIQELAFFSWFYGGTSLGAGGKYSDNTTFAGSAKLCPPGGTN